MRAIFGFVSLLLSVAIGLGVYYVYLKQATPAAAGSVATQAISTTGVQMDLNAIAQAERGYFAQNGSYGTLDQMTSSGALTMTRTGRDGYTYAVDASSAGFTATAKWSPQTPEQQTLHYPAFVVDQTFQVRELQ
jgi:hypothetical protein